MRLRLVALVFFAVVVACGDDLSGPPVPTALEAVGDTVLVGAVARPMGDSIRVRLVDQRGQPFAFARIFFDVEQGGGSVSPESVLTDSTGVAAALWTLGPGLGTGHRLRASAGIFEREFRATARHELTGAFTGPYSTPTVVNVSARVDVASQVDSVLTGTFSTGQGRRATLTGTVRGAELAATLAFTDPCGGTGTLAADIQDVGQTLLGTIAVVDCAGPYTGEFRLVRR